MNNSRLDWIFNQEHSPKLSINDHVKAHQRSEKEWKFHDAVTHCQLWADEMIFDFKVECVSTVICIEKLPDSQIGKFRSGHNGLGLTGEITLNQSFVTEPPTQRLLAVLLVQLLRAEQCEQGKPDDGKYYSKDLRDRAKSLGIALDKAGKTQITTGDSPFHRLLRRHATQVSSDPVCDEPRKSKRRSTLTKWCCKCEPPVNVRVGRAKFEAICLVCNHRFENAEKVDTL